MKVYAPVSLHDRPQPHFMSSLARLLSDRPVGFEFIYDPVLQVSNLARMRNLHVTQAIWHNADKILFMDDDMLFETWQATTLLETPGEVVAARYVKKSLKNVTVGYPLEAVGLTAASKGELTGMAAVGMGLTVVDVPFLKRMIEHMAGKELRGEKRTVFYEEPEDPGVLIAPLFEFKAHTDLAGKRRFMGEDEIFCQHVIENGGSVWMHMGVRIGHVGTHIFGLEEKR